MYSIFHFHIIPSMAEIIFVFLIFSDFKVIYYSWQVSNSMHDCEVGQSWCCHLYQRTSSAISHNECSCSAELLSAGIRIHPSSGASLKIVMGMVLPIFLSLSFRQSWTLAEGMMDIADTFDVQKLVSHLGCHYHGSPQSRRRKSWKLWLQRQVDRSMYWIQWDLLHPNAE